MQRAAVARALINRPRVLLADEPTGNLDAEAGGEVVRLLRDLNRQDGLTIIMVTHNMDIVAGTDRMVRLTRGRVEGAPEPHGRPPPNGVFGCPISRLIGPIAFYSVPCGRTPRRRPPRADR